MPFFIPPTSLQVAKNIAKQGGIGGVRRKSKVVYWCRMKLDNIGFCRILRLLSGRKSPKLSNSGRILPERDNDLKCPCQNVSNNCKSGDFQRICRFDEWVFCTYYLPNYRRFQALWMQFNMPL